MVNLVKCGHNNATVLIKGKGDDSKLHRNDERLEYYTISEIYTIIFEPLVNILIVFHRTGISKTLVEFKS